MISALVATAVALGQDEEAPGRRSLNVGRPAGEGRWSFGLNRPLGFYATSISGGFLWVPLLELSVVDRDVPTSPGCTKDIFYLDKNFVAPGATVSFEFGPFDVNVGGYAGSWSGAARSVTTCGGLVSENTFVVGGDIIAFELAVYVPLLVYTDGPWRFGLGPSVGFLGLIESPRGIAGHSPLFEYGATFGFTVSLDYGMFPHGFISLRAGGSWIVADTMKGWLPEITLGYGFRF